MLLILALGFLVWRSNKPNAPLIVPAKGVTVTTDKKEYNQGENIKITMKNNLKETIFSHAGSGTPVFAIDHIERRISNRNWETLSARRKGVMYDIDAPREIKLGQSATFEWKPWLYKESSDELIQAGPGRYRLLLLYEDYLKTEWKSVYSNEFTIKEKKEVVTPKDKKSCEALGGKWGTVGLHLEEVCNLPTSDAGKICSGSSECEGSCIAEQSNEDREKAESGIIYTKGKCTAWKITVGCHAFVENGKVEGILCAD